MSKPYIPNTRPRITTLTLPCRWYAPGKFANNPNWELRTLCEDHFLAEILQDGPHFFACVMGAEVPEIPFTTAHLAKIWCETYLADPANFK